ncbi:MAG: cytochrome b/b6 domain-containing protein [Desulfobacterales bacterium]|nr:cytochrome b/b6 domain-containing protein [Desulfobacterales bacterium]
MNPSCRFFPPGKITWLMVLLLLWAMAATAPVAQANGKTRLNLYRDRQITSGYFKEVDVNSPFYLPLVGGPEMGKRTINLPPRAGTFRRWRTFLADSHYGIRILPKQTCQECHPQQSRDKHTIRGQITCAQCHGGGTIAGINHYYSKMNVNRRHSAVCAKCHEGASNSYATFVVHAPSPAAMTTRQSFPMLFYAFWVIIAVAVGTFAVFLPHTLLWGVRDYMTTPRHGPQDRRRIKRFSLPQRLFHFLLMLSFMTLAATGFSRMFIETPWGKFLAYFFGGYQGAIAVHKWVGLFMLALFGVHLVYVLSKIDWRRFPKSLMGPDSLLLQWPDLRLAFQHLGWLFGRSGHPRFDRWGYWEKFDYWAVLWGTIVLGGTGLVMAYSLSLTSLIPGWTLNVALWLHRIEAMLAMAHVFIIHFFIAHMRRHTFPMDRAMFEGTVDLDGARHEKPAWIARLEQEGTLEANLAPQTNKKLRLLYYLIGFGAVGFGLFLLIGGIVNSPYITW